ncbi:unnamed protein product [Diamesa serratosioi]
MYTVKELQKLLEDAKVNKVKWLRELAVKELQIRQLIQESNSLASAQSSKIRFNLKNKTPEVINVAFGVVSVNYKVSEIITSRFKILESDRKFTKTDNKCKFCGDFHKFKKERCSVFLSYCLKYNKKNHTVKVYRIFSTKCNVKQLQIESTEEEEDSDNEFFLKRIFTVETNATIQQKHFTLLNNIKPGIFDKIKPVIQTPRIFLLNYKKRLKAVSEWQQGVTAQLMLIKDRSNIINNDGTLFRRNRESPTISAKHLCSLPKTSVSISTPNLKRIKTSVSISTHNPKRIKMEHPDTIQTQSRSLPAHLVNYKIKIHFLLKKVFNIEHPYEQDLNKDLKH